MKVIRGGEEPPQTATDPPGTEALIWPRRSSRKHVVANNAGGLSIMACVLVLAVVSAVLVSHLTSPAKKTTTRTVTKPTTAVPTCHEASCWRPTVHRSEGLQTNVRSRLPFTNRGHRPLRSGRLSTGAAHLSGWDSPRPSADVALSVRHCCQFRAGCFSASAPLASCWSLSPAASSVTFTASLGCV